eukprot:1988221-Ditylum_brightwellii.AAC.1
MAADYKTDPNAKIGGTKAKSDQENAKVFAKHFEKLFNNTSPLQCNKTVLEELFDVPEFLQLAVPPTVQE